MKKIIAIGGGELRERTTLAIDEYIAKLAKEHAGENRANALFIPTASHDFMPYYNTFHKVYTGVFNIKTDVALTVFKDVDLEKMKAKFEKADMIYVGGGDTVFMLESWKKTGLLPLIKDAYERGVIIAGCSAGAICWFEDIYTDSLEGIVIVINHNNGFKSIYKNLSSDKMVKKGESVTEGQVISGVGETAIFESKVE